MFRRRILVARQLLKVSCIVVLISPATVLGEGSISFNGSTSKLENGAAEVFAGGSSQVTILAWVKAPNNTGTIIWFDEGGTKLILQHHSVADRLLWVATTSGQTGKFAFPVIDGQWNAVAVMHDRTAGTRRYRVNFATATETIVQNPDTGSSDPLPGYSVGPGWNGTIRDIQVFNRVLSTAEADAGVLTPGSVRKNLQLWLPMTNQADVYDRSGNGFHGTATELKTGANGPPITRELTLPPGVAKAPVGTTTITQHVIPRYADGTNYPSGELLGYGKQSVLRASLSTRGLPVVSRAVVMTEDYDHANNIDYWQSGGLTILSGTISSISGGTPITVTTSSNHGRSTGESVTISGANDFPQANGTRFITVTSPTTFTLNGTSQSGSDDQGTWAFIGLPLTGSINTVSQHAMAATITTHAPLPSELLTGHTVEISGVTGTASNVNGPRTITVTGANTFTVPVGTSGTGMSGKWFFDRPPAVLRAVLRDVTIAGFPDPAEPFPAGDDYAGRGIIDSEPATHHKIVGGIGSISGTMTVTVTSVGHTLQTGEIVEISGVLGGFSPSFTITRTGDNTFTLIGATGNGGAHTANTGVWRSQNSFTWPDKENGALLKSSGLTVKGVNFFYIPGTCLVVGTGYRPENRAGSFRPFDSEKVRVWDCQFHRAYRGVEIAVVDALVGRLNGFGLRDYGIKFTYGAAQIDGALHFYGVGIGGVDQPAVWFAPTAGGCWGGPIYAENSPVGMRVESSGNKLTGFYSKECFLRNLWITGERNSIENFEIDFVPDGITEVNRGEAVLIGASRNTLSNGTIGGGAPVPAGEIAIRVKDGNAGQQLVIRDVTVQGTDNSTAPLISVEDTLENSVIDARCIDGGIFVDFYSNNTDWIGQGNFIRISTESITGTAAEFHPNWTTDPTDEDTQTNDIRVNGVRYYRAGG
jgi:hypothetical protein